MWSAVSHEGNRRWRVLMVAAGVVSIGASMLWAGRGVNACPAVRAQSGRAPGHRVCPRWARAAELGPVRARDPATSEPPPRPLIVWVHGGAWLGGSKDTCPALAVREPGLRRGEHQLPPQPARHLSRPDRGLQSGDPLAAGERRQVRLRSEPHRRLGRLGGRAPGRPARHHGRREGVRRRPNAGRLQPGPGGLRLLRPDRLHEDEQLPEHDEARRRRLAGSRSSSAAPSRRTRTRSSEPTRSPT